MKENLRTCVARGLMGLMFFSLMMQTACSTLQLGATNVTEDEFYFAIHQDSSPKQVSALKEIQPKFDKELEVPVQTLLTLYSIDGLGEPTGSIDRVIEEGSKLSKLTEEIPLHSIQGTTAVLIYILDTFYDLDTNPQLSSKQKDLLDKFIVPASYSDLFPQDTIKKLEMKCHQKLSESASFFIQGKIQKSLKAYKKAQIFNTNLFLDGHGCIPDGFIVSEINNNDVGWRIFKKQLYEYTNIDLEADAVDLVLHKIN